jgi:hypothetical protein
MSIEAMKQAHTLSMDGEHFEARQILLDAIEDAEKQKPLASAAYDRIDRFLRNNLDDIDYAAYSEALDRIYTHPQPKREWAGLTEEDIEEVSGLVDWSSEHIAWNFAIKIEAKLKEKNT